MRQQWSKELKEKKATKTEKKPYEESYGEVDKKLDSSTLSKLGKQKSGMMSMFKMNASNLKSKTLTEAIAQITALDYQPYSIVENRGFIH